MNKVTYLTEEGEKKLRAELKELSGTVRHELSKRLRSAIQMGDLSENADYKSAKEEQGFIEGRIQELIQLLGNVVIIDENSQAKETAEIGSKVTIQEDKEPEETYLLVGPQEADPVKGRISYSSPIGIALIGHKVGEIVTAVTPAGPIHFKILEIQ
ncbi:MAG: transcription elongation factor GreA [Chloroflexi bacterium]|nr:MAG: transcription elongation factor GreA [Chloroflexota bacterium]MBA4375229.1 transcription elongation factor GreA [Anaerolinea sp.]